MEMVVLRNTMMAGYACAQAQASIDRIHESDDADSRYWLDDIDVQTMLIQDIGWAILMYRRRMLIQDIGWTILMYRRC